jgi:catechol 2,3-dioxygenase-like lactoylglutathione lyase family enzyme
MGSVVKLNHHVEPLPVAAPSGYRELIIAREGLATPRPMVDPDGNRARLVPPGHDRVSQIGVAMGVGNLGQHRKFYADILGFAEEPSSAGLAFRLGHSLLLLEEDRRATRRPGPSSTRLALHHAAGRRNRRPSRESAQQGVREGFAPVTLGNVARISMIPDPDGNWIELSRRASIVGSLS